VGTVLQFRPRAYQFPTAPYSETLRRFAKRLTCRELHDKGQPAVVTEIIAKRLIEIAGRGERNRESGGWTVCKRYDRILAGADSYCFHYWGHEDAETSER
jgi:hypothetical protein